MEQVNIKCQNCLHYLANKDKHGTEGTCFRYPPTPYPFVQQSIVGSAPQIAVRMFRPIVRENEICGEFELNRANNIDNENTDKQEILCQEVQ